MTTFKETRAAFIQPDIIGKKPAYALFIGKKHDNSLHVIEEFQESDEVMAIERMVDASIRLQTFTVYSEKNLIEFKDAVAGTNLRMLREQLQKHGIYLYPQHFQNPVLEGARILPLLVNIGFRLPHDMIVYRDAKGMVTTSIEDAPVSFRALAIILVGFATDRPKFNEDIYEDRKKQIEAEVDEAKFEATIHSLPFHHQEVWREARALLHGHEEWEL